MNITVTLGPGLESTQAQLEQALESAINQCAAGGRPEFDAGKLAATVDLIDAIETAYVADVEAAAQRQRPRAVGDDDNG